MFELRIKITEEELNSLKNESFVNLKYSEFNKTLKPALNGIENEILLKLSKLENITNITISVDFK